MTHWPKSVAEKLTLNAARKRRQMLLKEKVSIRLQEDADHAIAEYVAVNPWQTPSEVARNFCLSDATLTCLLRPSGIPQWSRETVIAILDYETLVQNRGITPRQLRSWQFVWRAFFHYELQYEYPLHYRTRFHRLVYPLFELPLPADLEEEHDLLWPADDVLQKRYRHVMKYYHPDRQRPGLRSGDISPLQVATLHIHSIQQAYRLLLKRRAWITRGELPSGTPVISQKYGGRIASESPDE